MQERVSNIVSDALDNLGGALNTGGVTGWDVVAAVIVAVVSYPIARFAARLARGSIGQVSGASEEAAVDAGRIARILVYLIAGAIALGSTPG